MVGRFIQKKHMTSGQQKSCQTQPRPFRAKASTATRAKSKMKQIDKLETIEIDHATGNVRIRIPSVEAKAGVAFRTEDLDIGYPEKLVASGIRMEIERGSRVAVLGDNGQGKTTFLKTIAGDLKALRCDFKWGTGLKIGYYAQHVFTILDPRHTVYQHLRHVAEQGVGQQELLDLAGSFLFKGTDVDKKVSVLSGGERARLCLAGLLLTRSHVLLLDEPTNHLDFETVEALGDALQKFGGTVFFISHDRTFVNLVATSILDVKDGKIKRYPGSYEDYVYHLECDARDEEPSEAVIQELKTHTRPHLPGMGSLGLDEEEIETPRVDTGEKQKKTQIQKLKNKLRSSESKLLNMSQERSTLELERQRNPFHSSSSRDDRDRDLTIRTEKLEDEIRKLKSKIKKLAQSP